ncbi:phage major capsid protein [Macellibacteroides fermentans]|uniref:phage major capsid protein n=1 Tax=Macellibacteroides fermentans TaxID=879969 RepID=UPI00406CF2B6
MDSLTLIDQKEQLKRKAEELINTAEKEVRKLNTGEESELTSIKKEIADIEAQIKQIEETNKRNFKPQSQTKTMEKFSLLKAINDVANNRQLDERAQEVINAGVSEFRKAGQNYSGQIVLPIEERATVQATVATAGQENVAEDKLGILEPLRNSMVLVQAGANYMTGLVGNLSIPVYSGSNVTWAGEVAGATDGAGTFTEVTLEPKRITAFIDVSKQFLIQDSNSAEELLKRDIVNALAEKLEKTILGKEAGSTTQPAGMFATAPAIKGVPTYKSIVNIETALEEANVTGNKVFIVNPSAKSVLKTTEKATSTAKYLMEGDELDGYKVLTSNSVAKALQAGADEAGVVFGCFNDYVIGQWGGIDLTVDPYTQAANGKVRLVINAYFDAKPRRAASFVTASVK